MGKKAWLQNWVKENIDREKLRAELTAHPIVARLEVEKIDEMLRAEVRRQAFAAWDKTEAGQAEYKTEMKKIQAGMVQAVHYIEKATGDEFVIVHESQFKCA